MSTLRRVGKELRRWVRRRRPQAATPRPPLPTLPAALARLATRDLGIAGVIDVGASNGMWSAEAERHFPDAHYLLLEANPVHRQALETFCAQRPGASFELAAVGDVDGELLFDARDPFGGLALHDRRCATDIRLPAVRVDTAIAKHGVPGPYFLKLDVHGFEVPILAGAAEALRTTTLLQIEVYNHVPAQGALAFWDLCRHMQGLGFRPYDLCDPLWRPSDGFLWQFDLFFVRGDRPEFSSDSSP